MRTTGLLLAGALLSLMAGGAAPAQDPVIEPKAAQSAKK